MNNITDTYIHAFKAKTFGSHTNTKITSTSTWTQRNNVSHAI